MELHFLKTTWSDIIILKKGNTVAMIDTGFEEQYNSIKKYLDKMNIKKIKFILLTHFHRDHYGSISSIVKDYDVDKVYFKDYSALDKTTAWGTPADDQYRLNEYDKSIYIKKIIEENSKLIEVENINSIQFDKYKLKLYNNKNFIKKIYNDENYKDSYHKILFSENQNSLAVFFRVNNVNIFFGGDIFDRESIHPSANYVNYQIASSINEEINIYKVPHHGTIHCNSKKALDIYRPKIAVITNSEEYLKKESTVYQDLMRANKNVKILLTEKNNIVIKISDEGHISYEKS
ncbi:MAG: MBL fold metallo-hydrolase [Bacilli bacterium]|nr:MBL fold metallo-hydrolase [Bacilli bacterium]